VLLLQEFDFEVRGRKGCENQVADHLSRLEAGAIAAEGRDIDDCFPDELVVMISQTSIPWYANYANFIPCGLLHEGLSSHIKRKFLFDVKRYILDEPFHLVECADNVIWHCVLKVEVQEILEAFHASPVGGHHGAYTQLLKFCYVVTFGPKCSKTPILFVSVAHNVK